MTQKKTKIETKLAPAAIGPYSQAIKAGNFVFCSGQIPLVPETGELEKAEIRIQTRRVLSNLKAVLEAAGSHPKNIIKTTVFLSDMTNFVPFNEEYHSFFATLAEGSAPPARSTFAVAALPKNALVEVEAIASLE
jgi:2-iminobutanoate/2-iminopropanoate deaminase